jgi:sugar (pentulose or hexulose) kinase
VYVAFDVGTTSVKVVLFDRDGRLAAKTIASYQLETPGVNRYEADPELYWNAVAGGIREVMRRSGADAGEVRTVSGCSQGETVVLLGADDRPVRRAIVWLDQRARDEVAELSRLVPNDELYRVTGLTDMDPTWTGPKLLWVRRNEPEVFRAVRRALWVEDWITFRLTGRSCSSANLLSSSTFVDVHRKAYWPKTVEAVGMDGKLPEIVESGAAVGTVLPRVAAELGLSPKTLVVKGSMDQAVSALGAGNIEPGIVTETTGSVMAIGVTSRTADPRAAVRLPYQPHVVPGYLYLPYVQTAGSAYTWWRDQFSPAEVDAAGGDLEAAYEHMNRLAAAVPAGSEGLVFLPFLAGAGTPENDPDARGVFHGLTLKHGRGHCARAIQESIAFLLKKILADFARSGSTFSEVRSMGGGARSDLWLQIKADVTRLPIVRMEEEETSTLGAAMLAAVRCGDYPDAAAAAKAMVRLGRRFDPDPSVAGVYARGFALYNDLCAALAPLFRRYAH